MFSTSVPDQLRFYYLLKIIHDSKSNIGSSWDRDSCHYLATIFKTRNLIWKVFHVSLKMQVEQLEFRCQICKWQKWAIHRAANAACQKQQKVWWHQCIQVEVPFIQAAIYFSLKAGELLSPTPFHALLHVSTSITAQYPDAVFELWNAPIWDRIALKFLCFCNANSESCLTLV